jgi:non-specific serine/threonine protein kinase
MHELTITPEGHLLVRESSLETSDRKPSKRLLESYGENPARGMIFSATEEMDAQLPPSFEFARTIARLYLTNLCHAAIAEPGSSVPELPPPSAELEQAVLQAPPMTGLEYLSEHVLSNWWRDLDLLARGEITSHPGGAQGYLRERNPQWRYVGRVTLHLAENKRNPDYPFAFLATFANGLTPQGKVRHEPLGRALQQYAGEQNREAMLSLLLPISRAAESSELIRRLVDSGEIYHPLAWSPREAYEFLNAIFLFESSGLIVRVPDWWHAQKPTRPRVSVKINTKNSAGIGVDSLLEFSVGVSLEGETLGPDEIAELLESSGGLIPLRGKWVEVDREKLNEALTHWKLVEKDVRREGISFFEGMRLLSGANLAKEGEGESEASIREWTGLTAGAELDSILQGLRSPETRLEKVPPGLKAGLRPYQQTGYSWLRFVARLGLGACLADDMGLGKTVQVISLLLDLKREKSRNKAASLLVVPASLIANWKSELEKFAPSLSYAVVHPSEVNARGNEIGPAHADKFDLIVTTYGMLGRTDWMKPHRWQLAILDEAQAIKNSGTKQARAVKELTAHARIAMTGTPVENRLSDLWSLFDYTLRGHELRVIKCLELERQQ